MIKVCKSTKGTNVEITGTIIEMTEDVFHIIRSIYDSALSSRFSKKQCEDFMKSLVVSAIAGDMKAAADALTELAESIKEKK